MEPKPVELVVPVVVDVDGLAVAAAAPPRVFVPPRFPVKPVLDVNEDVVEPNEPSPPKVLVPPSPVVVDVKVAPPILVPKPPKLKVGVERPVFGASPLLTGVVVAPNKPVVTVEPN